LKQIVKNKSFQSFFATLAFVMIGGFLFFGNASIAKADKCECWKSNGWTNYDLVEPIAETASLDDCITECKGRNADHYRYGIAISLWLPVSEIGGATKAAKDVVDPAFYAKKTGDTISNIFSEGVKIVLGWILSFVGWLLQIAVIIFGWAADARSLTAVINGEAIYKTWGIVRDFLNMAFIIVLVYTAFTIIFQVDSSNKKIILTVVLMALLVNFSFPIARFIIDVGNSMMYTIFNNLFNGMTDPSNIFAYIAGDSQIGNIINGTLTGGSATQLIASIIFVSILAITLLMISILFVIRIVALAIIIIFSPIAFVGAAVPSMSSKTGQWWDYLFKYTFFGPAMAFMIFIAMVVMKTTVIVSAGLTAQNDPVLSSMATFAIPIVILWIGMSLAQKMGIAGADVARKWSTAAFNKVSGVSFGKKTWEAYRARRKAADEDSWSKKMGTYFGSQQDRLRAKYLPGGRDAALRFEKDEMEKIKKEGERNGTEFMGEAEARKLITSSNKYARAAGYQRLSELGVAGVPEMKGMIDSFGETSQAFRQMQNKVKAYNPAAAFDHITNATLRDSRIAEHVKSNQFDAGKLNADALGSDSLMRIMFENQAISREDLEKHRIKSQKHADNIKTSLDAIIGGATNSADVVHQNIQKSYLQQHGKLSAGAAASTAWQEELFKTGDKDTFKRMSLGEITTHADAMTTHMNSGKLKDVVQNMQSNDARAELVRYIKQQHAFMGPIPPNQRRLGDIVEHDFYLNSL
jgi:hypothetical protein